MYIIIKFDNENAKIIVNNMCGGHISTVTAYIESADIGTIYAGIEEIIQDGDPSEDIATLIIKDDFKIQKEIWNLAKANQI